MDRKRKILLVVFILASVAGMWVRHSYQKGERLRMERTLAELARVQREQRLMPSAPAGAAPAGAEVVVETRDMFASDLPRESFEAIRQAVGGDFKLMELRFANELTKVLVSTDGQSVQEYVLYRDKRRVEGPKPVKLLGDNPLADSLYEPKAADLGLLPKLAQDALGRAGLEGARVTSVSFAYEFIRYKGESPVWTVMVERGKAPPDWDHKFVTFDAKGKFKRTS